MTHVMGVLEEVAKAKGLTRGSYCNPLQTDPGVWGGLAVGELPRWATSHYQSQSCSGFLALLDTGCSAADTQ